jgi:hypothetical protein
MSHTALAHAHRSDEYHKVALAGIEHKPELAGLDRAAFERSPPEAMRGLLRCAWLYIMLPVY